MPISSPEDVLNESYRAIGVKLAIGDIYEGSPQARAGLEIYSQTRDEVLQEEDWPFAMRQAVLVQAAGAVPAGWVAKYAYPSDALRIRYVRPATLADPNDPQPVLFEPFNDTSVIPPALSLLSSLPATAPLPIAIYLGRVTDPLQWLPNFTDALITRLAAKLAPQFSPENVGTAVAVAGDVEARASRITDMMAPPAPPLALSNTARTR